MTRKNFNKFADLIALMYFMEGQKKEFTILDIENHIKAIFQADNENFDNEKWDKYVNKQIEELKERQEDRNDRIKIYQDERQRERERQERLNKCNREEERLLNESDKSEEE